MLLYLLFYPKYSSEALLQIIHVNLAKGFRGGERQTVLLIQALAKRTGVKQQALVCQPLSPLRDELADTPNVRFVNATSQLAGHWRAGKADVVHAHEAKAVHWAWLHKKLFQTPYILTRRVDTPIKRKWSNVVFYRNAHRCVAISSAIANEIGLLSSQPIPLVPSAFTPFAANSLVAKTLRHTHSGRFIVGHVGALVDRHKGQRVLLEAARELAHTHPDILFLFFGQGDDASLLHKESADLDNVVWMGFKPNINDYLPSFDLFAFPSRNEGLGSVLLDVMNAKVPVIASEVGGIPDIVKHLETGFLTPPNNAKKLTEGIVALKQDALMREQLVTTALSRLHNYSAETMASAYISLYHTL